ncbi:putative mannosyl-oligosaccharide alpha-1,2-mannosidase [Alternaria alternata]|nr:putative mannosyl-oligosaccharide alpha-1,2-mannosidase [Alternaria alternata]
MGLHARLAVDSERDALANRQVLVSTYYDQPPVLSNSPSLATSSTLLCARLIHLCWVRRGSISLHVPVFRQAERRPARKVLQVCSTYSYKSSLEPQTSVNSKRLVIMHLTSFALGSGILSLVSALPSNTPVDLPKRQDEAPPPTYASPPSSSDERAQAVVGAFRTSWDGYRKYAFPMDELRPLSNNGSNSRYVTKFGLRRDGAKVVSETGGEPPP